jgi:hypothetical protein
MILGAFFLMLPDSCLAQLATLTGVVRDESGAAMPNADIELTNTATDEKRTQPTSDAGTYTFPALQPGLYTLRASASGFASLTITGIQLQVEQVGRQDITLKVSEVSQNVTVSGAPPILQTEEASTGEVIGSRQVVDLPLNGRSFKQLALLLPGTVPETGTNNQSYSFNIPRGNFQSNGTYNLTYSYRVDGVENFHKFLGVNLLDVSIDGIHEFKIEQNNFSVDSGRGTTVTSIVTRSGSNEFHGSLYEFLRNDALDASNFFDRPESGGKGSFRLNQFGGSIGGPIIKEKLFFFANAEARRSLKGQTQYANFPTPAQLSGDLSGMGPILDADRIGTASCPTGSEPGCFFANNQIPADRISQYARAANAYWPVPNAPGILPGVNDVENLRQKNNFTQETIKLDWTITDTDRLSARFTSDSSRYDRPQIQPLTDLNTTYHTSNVAVRWAHTFSPTTINDFLFGYNFGNYRLEVPFTTRDVSGDFGLKNTDIRPEYYGIPWTQIIGFARQGPNSWEPWYEPEKIFQWTDGLTLVRGKHTFKAGGELMHYGNKSTEPFANRGFIFFTGAVSGNSLADYLLGNLGFAFGGQGDPSREHSRYISTLYVGDDWKVTPNLTLNLGIRWDGATQPTEKNNRMAIFDPNLSKAPGDALSAYRQANVGGEGRAILDSDLATFAPRFGFAYRPLNQNRVVVRGGFGIFYGFALLGQEEQFFATNLPFFYLNQMFSQGPTNFYRTTDLFPAPPPLFPDPNAKFVDQGQGMYTILQNIKFPRSNQWNLAVQTLLTSSLSLDVSYVGQSSHHLPDRWDLNQAVLPSAAEVESGDFSSITSRRPFPTLAGITATTYWANSNYNALQVKIEKRFSQGLSFLGAYTWGKAIDDANIVAYEGPLYLGNRSLEKGRGGTDARQIFNFSYGYELPFGSGKRYLSGAKGVSQALLGGWVVNGITTFRTGMPLTIADTFDRTQTGSPGPRPDRTCDGNLPSDQRTPTHWFDTSCFAAPRLGVLGNAGRRLIDAPGTNNFDISLFKRFNLWERTYLEFRAEFFNSFNHPQFDPPGQTFGTPGFGVITSARDPREIQFALKFVF